MTKFISSQFVLAVPDLRRSVTYYRDVLGFSAVPIEDSGWMFMVRDNCVIRLGECPDAISPADLGDHSYFGYLEVDDADAFFDAIDAAGGETIRPPRDETWGMREFPVRTIDGHRFMVGQRI